MQRSTKEEVEEEIGKIHNRLTLASYLIWKIDVLDELHIEQRKNIRANPLRHGEETARRIRLFIKRCIELFNESHPREEPWTYAEMMFILRNAWFVQTKIYLHSKTVGHIGR